ncbi:fibronectin type III domain-containing protein [Candidatus Poriferisocius sp.]|uniref:fibronectin type III domain-containing protein n=1 Tax=Candidatus Poriferisocius sp. TaxID=3101276 RepID=UPI003B02C272
MGLVASITAYASAQTGNVQQGTPRVIDEDFCLRLSLGGPVTYPFDSNGDGVADICSLNTTRRATAARQNALEQLASEFPLYFGQLWADECLRVDQSYGEPVHEPRDECAAPRLARATGRPIPPVPRPRFVVETTNPFFFSGPVITGPSFCLNFSFGGPITYPFDSDNDGVADICSLPTTRRATVARQKAFDRLAVEQDGLYEVFFSIECRRVPATFGNPEAEASDECAPHRDGTGIPGRPGTGDDEEDDESEDNGQSGGGPGGTGITAPTLPTAPIVASYHVAAPQNILLETGTSQIIVKWSDPLADRTSVFRYHVEWSTNANFSPSQRIIVVAASPTAPCSTSADTNADFECTITGLTNFETYYVRIQAVRGTNDRYTPSGNSRTTPQITPGLAGPPIWASDDPRVDTDVAALVSGEFGEITATWNAPLGSSLVPAYYHLQWSTSPSSWSTNQQLRIDVSNLPDGCTSSPASGDNFACTIAGLTNNRTYYMRIQGIPAGSGPGTWSLTEQLSLASTLQDPGLPTNVELIAAGATGKDITVTWDAPAVVPGSDPAPTHYLVQWRACGATGSSCDPWSAIARQERVPDSGDIGSADLTETISGLNYEVYQVRVQAVNSTVGSGWTRAASITLGQSEPPTNINWSPGVTTIDVTWDAVTSLPGVRHYFIQVSSSSGFSCSGSSPCDSTTSTTASHSITGFNGGSLVINGTYYVRIRTVNTNDVPSSWSPTVSMVPGTVAAPTDVNADEVTGNPRSLDLTWSSEAAAQANRPAPNGFRVRWRATGTTNWRTSSNLSLTQAGDGDAACTNYCYTLAGLTGGTEYEVQVQVRNSYGYGPWSTTTTDSTETPGSSFAPTSVNAAETLANPTALTVSWARDTWGVDADNDPLPVTGFVVQSRVEGATNWGSSRTLGLTTSGLDTSNAPTYTYTLTGLTAGTAYEVRVRASNRNGQGAWSDASAAATPGASFTPASVAAVDINTNPRSLSITWSNASITPTGFTIQWRATDTTRWSSRSVSLAQATVDGCTYCYILTNLTAGTEYEVRVQARNAAGSGPWSDVSSAATPGSQLTPTGLSSTPSPITGVNEATVNWGGVTPGTGLTLRNYTVQWRSCGPEGITCEAWSSSSSRQYTTAIDTTQNPTPTSYEITRLLDYYTYEWRVRANFTNGTNSPWALSNP